MKTTLWINGLDLGKGQHMAKAGRKRREGVNRYACGQIVHDERGESEAEAKAVVLAQRTKEVGLADAGKFEAGFELGKAYLRGDIMRHEMMAGLQWARNVDRYARMHGYPSPCPKAMDWLSSKGRSEKPEPRTAEEKQKEEDDIKATSNTYMKGLTAIKIHGRQAEVACQALCIEDSKTGSWPPHTWRALRKALQGLAGLYGIVEFLEENDKAA